MATQDSHRQNVLQREASMTMTRMALVVRQMLHALERKTLKVLETIA